MLKSCVLTDLNIQQEEKGINRQVLIIFRQKSTEYK
jgi:hypothetical protein